MGGMFDVDQRWGQRLQVVEGAVLCVAIPSPAIYAPHLCIVDMDVYVPFPLVLGKSHKAVSDSRAARELCRK